MALVPAQAGEGMRRGKAACSHRCQNIHQVRSSFERAAIRAGVTNWHLVVAVGGRVEFQAHAPLMTAGNAVPYLPKSARDARSQDLVRVPSARGLGAACPVWLHA